MTELEQSLRDIGIFPVVTVRDAAHAAPLARVLCEEGIPAAEVTFRAPGIKSGKGVDFFARRWYNKEKTVCKGSVP